MDLFFFLKGLAIGFLIAVPIGPIGILCARRVLTHGRRAAFLSGMGAATADAFYAFIAAFGLNFISDIPHPYRIWLRVAGGALLCLLGIKTFIDKPERLGLLAVLKKKRPHAGMYASTFFFTLANPTTFFSLAAVLAAFGLAGTRGSVLSAVVLIVGVFLGSLVWWLTFVGVFSIFSRRIERRKLRWINEIAGLIIMGFGVLTLASLMFHY